MCLDSHFIFRLTVSRVFARGIIGQDVSALDNEEDPVQLLQAKLAYEQSCGPYNLPFRDVEVRPLKALALVVCLHGLERSLFATHTSLPCPDLLYSQEQLHRHGDTRNSCLNVLLSSAKGLASADIGSESDPYVTLQVTGGEVTESPLKSRTVQDDNGMCVCVCARVLSVVPSFI